MKKQKCLLLLLIAVMVFALAACNDGTMEDVKDGAFITISFGRDTSRTAVTWAKDVDDKDILHNIFIDDNQVGTGIKIGDSVKTYAADPGNHKVSVYGYYANTLFSYGEATVTVVSGRKTQCNVTMGPPPSLSGTITITPGTGVITVGTQLTAEYSGSETVSYQWKKDGSAITDATEATYTPTEAGSYTVTVSSVGYSPKTSAAVDVVREYTIEIEMLDNESGDVVTASPEKGVKGIEVTLTYTVASTAFHNKLGFGGVNATIAPVESAGTGTRTYTISADDASASNGVITITAVFIHTDLKIDPIAFSEHDGGHITKTYGDASFTNAVPKTYQGDGPITYHSDNENVATVNGNGQVTIHKAGSAVISAEKAADDEYAHAQTTYTLTVNPKPVTITGLSASNKTYNGTTAATVTGTAVISGLVSGDTVTVIAGTASFADAAVGNNKTVTFSGYSLGGANAGNYILSAQPASVTANILPNGSAAAPFLVANEADLRKVGTGTDGWTMTAHYRQTANISLSGSSFTRIGNNTSKFTGTYDGDGYNITGLTITASSSYQGLFGYIGASGTVKNMNVTGTVTQNGSGTASTGGIAGENEGTIDNCTFSGTVNGGSNNDQVGGITGQNNGTVINCRNNATVSGRNQVGGIAGTSQGKTENSYNTGAISGNQQVGGVAGTNVLSGNYIKNCYNTGNVTSNSASGANTGGIVGLNQQSALVEYCYNTGNVSGGSVVGGIVGNNNSGCTVRYCVSLGARVTCPGVIGRVAGTNGGTLTGNRARQDMKIGASGSEATTTANATETAINGGSNSIGTAQSNVFGNFSTTIWNISGNLNSGALPTLKTNTQSPAPTLP
jgi:hypothetical protein